MKSFQQFLRTVPKSTEIEMDDRSERNMQDKLKSAIANEDINGFNRILSQVKYVSRSTKLFCKGKIYEKYFLYQIFLMHQGRFESPLDQLLRCLGQLVPLLPELIHDPD